MKNSKLVLTVALVLIVAIISYVLIGKQSENTSQTAQSTGVQDDKGAKAEKENSFSVKKPADSGDPELTATVAKGKNFLITQVDSRLKQLSTFKSRVEHVADFDENERKTVLAELNDEIGALASLKAEVNTSETKEDVRVVADKIKEVWLKSRASVSRAEGQLLAAQGKSVISEAEGYSGGLKKRIEVLKAEGKSTKDFEKLMADYNKKVASAKKDMEAAQKKAEAAAKAASEEEKTGLIKEKDVLSKSAHDDVKEAYKLLREGAKQEFDQRFK
jgi:hypothetical protein